VTNRNYDRPGGGKHEYQDADVVKVEENLLSEGGRY
jgi:hypothetical protein